MPKQERGCKVEGCFGLHKAMGYCQPHYQRFRRGLPLDAELKARDRDKPEHCTVEGCEAEVKAIGYCKKHYARFKRHDTTDQTRVRKPCAVEGCEDLAQAKGLCDMHYRRQKKTGTTDAPVRGDYATCSVGGCNNIVTANDLCQKHYTRHQRHGHILDTRPADWGAREKHPLYRVWNGLMRIHGRRTSERWHDLWAFVEDIGDSRPSEEHILTQCDSDQPFGPTNFYWRVPQESGRTIEEKAERAEYMRAWNIVNAEKLINRNLKKNYGITFDDYVKMFDAQVGVCDICRQPETRVDHRTKKVSRLAVDHDHGTGKVRGLLCHAHNNSLGHFSDDPALLTSAILYLAKHSADPSAVLTAAISKLQAALPAVSTA